MCLAKIGKRTMGEEGYGWKTFFKVVETEEIYTLIRECSILPDCWLLNQEPSKNCSCGVVYKSSLEELKERYNSASPYQFFLPPQLSPLQTYSVSSIQSTTSSPTFASYEHGFHLWKECKEGLKASYARDTHWIKSALEDRTLKLFSTKVFYKGYIAEDDNQIVSRQIYVPISTLSPTDISKTYEVNKREYVTV